MSINKNGIPDTVIEQEMWRFSEITADAMGEAMHMAAMALEDVEDYDELCTTFFLVGLIKRVQPLTEDHTGNMAVEAMLYALFRQGQEDFPPKDYPWMDLIKVLTKAGEEKDAKSIN